MNASSPPRVTLSRGTERTREKISRNKREIKIKRAGKKLWALFRLILFRNFCPKAAPEWAVCSKYKVGTYLHGAGGGKKLDRLASIT